MDFPRFGSDGRRDFMAPAHPSGDLQSSLASSFSSSTSQYSPSRQLDMHHMDNRKGTRKLAVAKPKELKELPVVIEKAIQVDDMLQMLPSQCPRMPFYKEIDMEFEDFLVLQEKTAGRRWLRLEFNGTKGRCISQRMPSSPHQTVINEVRQVTVSTLDAAHINNILCVTDNVDTRIPAGGISSFAADLQIDSETPVGRSVPRMIAEIGMSQTQTKAEMITKAGLWFSSSTVQLVLLIHVREVPGFHCPTTNLRDREALTNLLRDVTTDEQFRYVGTDDTNRRWMIGNYRFAGAVELEYLTVLRGTPLPAPADFVSDVNGGGGQRGFPMPTGVDQLPSICIPLSQLLDHQALVGQEVRVPVERIVAKLRTAMLNLAWTRFQDAREKLGLPLIT